MGRNVFWGETSYLCFLTKKVGRNVFWGETSQGEMSWVEMSSGEKRPAPENTFDYFAKANLNPLLLE